MSWNIIVISVCVLLAAFAVYREYQRESKSHLIWRIAAVILSISALACIILPVAYPGKTTNTTGPGKLLLTDGFNADSVTNDKKDSIYTLNKSIHLKYPKAKMLDNISDLFTDTTTKATPIHIYGYGLDQEELNKLADKPITFHPSPAPNGFTSISWTEKLKTGEQFSVQGKYKNTSGKAYQLLLKGLNTTLDSTVIPAKGIADFTLSTTPKSIGRAVYSLVVINDKDTIGQEQLPVIIERTQPLKVLILSASPDFESKFLKAWLSENGYGVASRSTISKVKFSQEYVNLDKIDLSRLSTSLLSKFDVLVGDLSLLKSLNPAESGALQQEVMQKGLGVIIRADSAGKGASWLQSGFAVTTVAGKLPAPSKLLINGNKTTALTIDATYINANNNTQPLVADDHNHTLAAKTLAGAGKLAFTTIGNSYNWMLAGDTDDYRALWSLLIGKVARKSPVAENWQVGTDFPTINQPVQLVLENSSVTGDIKINNISVYPAQNPTIAFQRTFIYWPSATGWQQTVHTSNAPYWWYAWPKNQWQSLKAAKKLSLTAQYVKAHAPNVSVTKQIQQKTDAAVPKIYFYILFLMAATFLWAESKFFS